MDLNNTPTKLVDILKDQYNIPRKLFPDKAPSHFFDSEGNFISEILGTTILTKINFMTTKDNETLYVYNESGENEGIWTQDGEIYVKAIAQRLLGDKFNTHRVNETIQWIKGATHIDRDKLAAPKNIIVMRNGAYDFENKKFLQHSLEYRATSKIPVDYAPTLECSKIKKFLNEIVEPEDVEKLVEFIGYCLYRDIPIHRTFLLVGEGANGKSTFIQLVKAFLGEKNVSSVSLQALFKDRFVPAQLYNKLANLYPDLTKEALNETGILKALTGNDSITVEKKFKDPFDFQNYAKMIFSANEIPRSYDSSRAFYQRWLIVKFPNIFDESNADIKIIEKITTPDELSGLFNWAVEALENLLKRGAFDNEPKYEERKDEYVMLSNPIEWFALHRVILDIDNEISKSEVYEAYINMCRNELGVRPQASNVFSREFKRFVAAGESVPDIKGKRVKCWTDINLANHQESEIEDLDIDDLEPPTTLDDFEGNGGNGSNGYTKY